MKKIIYTSIAVAMFATFAAAQGSTPAWADKGCVAFVNGTGDYDQNCYSSGLERMAPGKCYTFNTARGQVPTWINNQATETWWWVETQCVSAPPAPTLDEDHYILQDKGCINFVNGTGDYDKHCYKSGLERMAPGKCYTFNKRRGNVPQWINNQASEVWWWDQIECADIVPTLKIATWNIRVIKEDDINAGFIWLERLDKMVDMIQSYKFDILGIQEDFDDGLKDLMPRMTDIYDSRGFDNHDKSNKLGSFNTIFFRKDLFEHLESGLFYLAEDITQPMKSWGSKHTRSCTWVKLKHKYSGEILWVFNAHVDYSPKSASTEEAKVLVREIKNIAGENDRILLMGDLNSTPTSTVYEKLSQSGYLFDSFNLVETNLIEEDVITYNAQFDNGNDAKHIDYIFVTDPISVLEYDALQDQYESGGMMRYPSDHFPVVIKIKL